MAQTSWELSRYIRYWLDMVFNKRTWHYKHTDSEPNVIEPHQKQQTQNTSFTTNADDESVKSLHIL